MTHRGFTVFTGASGKGYSFDIYTRGSNLDPVGGVYIFANGENCVGPSSDIPCDPILIDEADDLSEIDQYNACLNEYGADLLCVHFEDDEERRRHIYEDISQYYQDVPCE